MKAAPRLCWDVIFGIEIIVGLSLVILMVPNPPFDAIVSDLPWLGSRPRVGSLVLGTVTGSLV